MRIVIKINLIIAAGVLLLMSSVPVWAEESESGANTSQTTTTQTTKEGAHKNIERGTEVKTKLAAVKLKNCQKREKNINNIMSRIADRGQKQLDLFTKIAQRTETFYVTKGKTLSNYDALVADVSAKKTAAQTTVDTIKSSSVSFKCDGSDPKGAADSFKASQKSEISALKAYKTAVKNLIVGVKSVQDTTSSDETSGGTQQ